MSLSEQLTKVTNVLIKQKRELVELLGFETRNQYAIQTEDGAELGFAAEKPKGIFGAIFRQFLGHWRSFEIDIFNDQGELEYVAKHPFRFYFQRLEVYRAHSGECIGAFERRFEILGKRFDVMDRSGDSVMTVRSPLWRIWTFRFMKNDNELAVVTKKWGGVLKEAFLDADSFALHFTARTLSSEQRVLLLAGALFIDLRYFENKASGGGSSLFNVLSN